MTGKYSVQKYYVIIEVPMCKTKLSIYREITHNTTWHKKNNDESQRSEKGKSWVTKEIAKTWANSTQSRTSILQAMFNITHYY
jgi:hypothetical protein